MRLRNRAAVCCLLVGTAAHAQKADAPQWPRVRVNVSVMDQNDVPAVGVTADALEITEDNRVVKDAVLRPAGDAPESVCLLVDMSGSTYEARDEIHAELEELIEKLPPQDEVCLVDFSSVAFLDVPLTTDRAKVRDGLKYLKPGGGSALLEAVHSTAQDMEGEKYSQRVVVLISDGGENASKVKGPAVLRVLHLPGAPVVYSLVNRGSGVRDRRGETLLRTLTDATGGLEFPVKSSQDALAAVDGLVQAIKGRYELEFTANDPTADGKERKLGIALKKEVRKQKMEVVGPDGYVAAQQ